MYNLYKAHLISPCALNIKTNVETFYCVFLSLTHYNNHSLNIVSQGSRECDQNFLIVHLKIISVRPVLWGGGGEGLHFHSLTSDFFLQPIKSSTHCDGAQEAVGEPITLCEKKQPESAVCNAAVTIASRVSGFSLVAVTAVNRCRLSLPVC